MDVNGDGKADVLWRKQTNGQNWLWTMDGIQVTSSKEINTIGLDWHIAGQGDFDGDGKSDILWRNSTSGRNWMYLMDGHQINQSKEVNYISDLNWKIRAVADFNGDGKDDVLWRNRETGQSWVYLMNGKDIQVSKAVKLVADLDWQIVTTADINGDNKSDVIWRHATTGQNYVFLMDGYNIIDQYTLNTISKNWRITGSGDFNGDGTEDIIWRNYNSGANWLYLMENGQIKQSKAINVIADSQWKMNNIADYDGDNKSDIMWRHYGTGQTYIYLMDGFDIKSRGWVTGVNTDWNIVSSHDLDNDGLNDNVDEDIDGDGIANSEDAFSLDEIESLDSDGDGIGNVADADDDNDGISDENDAFPIDENEWNDSDGDGVGDNSDPFNGAFSSEMLVNKSFLVVDEAKEGWLQNSGEGLNFAPSNTAKLYSSFYHSQLVTHNLNWTVTGGSVELTGHSTSSSFIQGEYPYSQVQDYGFDESVQNALISAHDNGLISYYIQLELRQGVEKVTMTLDEETDSAYEVSTDEEYVTQLVMPDEVNWQGDTPTISETREREELLLKTENSLFSNKNLTGISGNWVMPFDYIYMANSTSVAYPAYSYELLLADNISITNTSAFASLSNTQYTPTLINGDLVLTNNNTSYKVRPLTQEGKVYLARIEKWESGELKYSVARQVAKFDESYSTYTNNIATELPEAQVAFINSWLESEWSGDKIKLEGIWGYLFRSDGVLYRGISGNEGGSPYDYYDDLQVDHFHLGEQDWTWSSNNNLVELNLTKSNKVRNRTWEVLSFDDQNRALILEYSTYGRDDNNDGTITEDEVGPFILPRLNIMMKEDLSRWSEAWNNTEQ